MALGFAVYMQVWRPSWLRAADCLVRSRTHFVLRLRGPPGASEGAAVTPKGPLVLLPVCSPLILGPQTYSAAEEPQQQLLPQRWEETVWHQQQQQAGQGKANAAEELSSVEDWGVTGGPLDTAGAPQGPLSLDEETDSLWGLQQERTSFRDELFGCTGTSSSSSFLTDGTSDSRVVWRGGPGSWAVRALGPPCLDLWVQGVLSFGGNY